MYGGHYVALSKVEEVALQDTAALRAYHTAQSGAPDSSEASLGAGGLADPLSLQEFISTTAPAGLSAASPTVASASCHTSSGIPEAPGFKWLKFDDEFVNALPSDSAATLHSTVVTGMRAPFPLHGPYRLSFLRCCTCGYRLQTRRICCSTSGATFRTKIL